MERNEKIEIEERMTTDLTTNVYSMSVSAKSTTTVTKAPPKVLHSVESRERDYTYDDAIEDYKTRVSAKLDLPKVDITKRRELFEKEVPKEDGNAANVSVAAAKLGTEIVSIKDRISSLRSNLATSTVTAPAPKKLEVPVSTKLKDRLSSLHQQISSPVDEPKRTFDTTFKNVAEARNEFEMKQQQQQQPTSSGNNLQLPIFKSATDDNESLGSTDREDSGIHTTDISCSVSQADEQQPTERIEEFQRVIQEKFTKLNVSEKLNKPDVIEHVNSSHIRDVADDEDPEMDEEDINDESSVSCSDDEQNQSVLVSTNLIAAPVTNAVKASNTAMLNFIQCNLIDENSHQIDNDNEHIDNDYVYECIINQSSTIVGSQTKSNGLEKSNSVDTALSLCSSSDGTSLMDDYDEKIHN